MFYGDRLVDIPDGKPKWTGKDGDGETELGWDSPQDAIEKWEKDKEEKKKKEEADEHKDKKVKRDS